MLVPPDNFALVEDGIYRCSKLDPINHSFLDTLSLKSIIWLDEERPSRILTEYIEENHVKLYHVIDSNVLQEDGELSNTRHQDWMVLKPALISRVFQILLNSRTNYNCLLIDKSEVIVGILRHIERWCYSSIANEYRLFSTTKANYSVESFLELINVELVSYEQVQEDEKLRGDDDKLDGAKPSIRETTIHEEKEPTEQAIDDDGTHSKAISINSRRPSFAMRRLSGTEGKSSSQNSAGSGKLSMSTSPQIPKNLLKLVEDRRQRKRERDHHRKKQQQQQQQKQQQPNEYGVRALDSRGIRDWSLASPRARSVCGNSLKSERSLKREKSNESDKSSGGVKRYHFYKPRKAFKVIDVRNKVLPTTIKIKLPKEEDLPTWFVELRDSWEEEYRKLNGVSGS